MENIILGFNYALADQSLENINLAFKDWMRSSAAMPTPADILKLAEERYQLQSRRNINPTKARPASRIEETPLPWVGVYYKQALSEGLIDQYFTHWLPQTERLNFAYEWLIYAYDHLGYPIEVSKEFARLAGIKTRPIIHTPREKV